MLGLPHGIIVFIVVLMALLGFMGAGYLEKRNSSIKAEKKYGNIT
jgi:hypothetical protein